MILFIKRFIICSLFCGAAAFGAWLGGASLSWYTAALAILFSVLMSTGVAIAAAE
jgi:hypothetical protein